MIQLQKILYPTDFSRCAEQALPYAILLAREFHAELHMLHAVVLFAEDPYNPAYHFPDKEELFQKLNQLATERMAKLLEGVDTDDLSIKQVKRRGISAAEVILEYAIEEDINLIVMGTHGRRGLKRILLGSVAEEVLRKAPCPVLTVREQAEPRPANEIIHILVPIDFSSYSQIALIHARELAHRFGAKLQLLHVIEDTEIHPAFYNAGVFSIRDLRPTIEEETKELLQRFYTTVPGPEVPVEYHVIYGRATQEIPEFARQHNSDLIVMSTHGLTGLEAILIGSVTEKVVRYAPCPVLTLKAFGKTLIPREELEKILAQASSKEQTSS